MFFRRRNRDLEEEIRSHLSMAERDRLDRGETHSSARLSARREFGNEALVREVTRGMWGWAKLERVWQDLHYAFRQLRANPGFTAAAVLTLALGIGANSAIFSVVNAVVLNPLPFPHSDRLVWAWGRFPGGNMAAVNPIDFREYRSQSHSFEHLGAVFALGLSTENWNLNGQARQLQGAMVTADLFEAFGQTAVVGRNFTRADEQVSQPGVVALSYHLWQEAYGGDPNVIGATARMDSSPVTIVGVMPAALEASQKADFWFPLPMLAPGVQNHSAHFLRLIGLRKAGVSMSQAQAELDAIAARLGEQYPESNKDWGLRLEPLRDVVVGSAGPVLLMMLGAVGLVLLIACVNIANLLLARYGARNREIAIRTAIGAGRWRILGQLLTENLVLAALAGCLAILVAYGGVQLVRSMGPASLPRLNEVRLDGRVLGFTALVSVCTALFFGLAPAWLATSAAPLSGLREDARGGTSRRRQALGAALVVSETALSVCLLIGAALMLQSLLRELHAPPGFATKSVVEAKLVLPDATYPDASSRDRFLRLVTGRVLGLPGVQAAGAITEMPLNNEWNDTFFAIVEHPPKTSNHKDNADFRFVTPGYFQAMQIPLTRGRTFDSRDQASAERVVLVDEPFVRRYFRDEDPLGKHIKTGVVCRIVGVVGGVRNHSLQLPPRPTIYLPFSQDGHGAMHLFVRTASGASALAEPVRQIVARQDPDVALSAFHPMEHFITESTSGASFDSLLLGLFALLALALAMAGVYGVFSYVVTQQTHEIGVRMALGARPGQMLGTILLRGVRLAALGAGLGLLASFFLMRVLASQLYQVKPHDPATFAAAAVILVAIAMLACAIPARRAMRVDPLVALRCE
jgi:putative ABC transport system permease protein